jgi:hypothetical protein
MNDTEHNNIRRRKTLTNEQKRERLYATHRVAMETIAAEAEARRKRTEQLRAAREAASKLGGAGNDI